jgi:hypothetical protein
MAIPPKEGVWLVAVQVWPQSRDIWVDTVPTTVRTQPSKEAAMDPTPVTGLDKIPTHAMERGTYVGAMVGGDTTVG